MHEIDSAGIAAGRRTGARGSILRRSLVDRHQGLFRPGSPRFGFLVSLLLRMSITLAGFFLVGDEGTGIGGLACLLGFVVARFIVQLTPPKPERPPVRLSPDEMIFWQHGWIKLNGTIAFTWGLMFVLVCRFEARHPQAVDRTNTIPMAEPARNRGYRHREANRRCGPARAGKVYWISGYAVSVH